MSNTSNKYKGKKILVTGATGFIGSNLVDRLVKLNADVTILTRNSNLNLKNVKVIIGDIRDIDIIKKAVVGKDIIFNLAAQVSHMDKNIVSYEDLDINCRGQLVLLESCRLYNPKVKIVFSSTRMVYGENTNNPITEDHPTRPLSIYGIHKLTAEKYHLTYHEKYAINCTILRIGNPYGDKQHNSKGLYSLPGWFMDKAIKGEVVEITSSGKQIRDYIYIGDLIEILIRVGLSAKTNGQIYNCSSGIKHTFGEMVKEIANIVNDSKFVYINKGKKEDNNVSDSYYLDVNKLKKDINFRAKIKLSEGVKLMYKYAKKHPTNDNN